MSILVHRKTKYLNSKFARHSIFVVSKLFLRGTKARAPTIDRCHRCNNPVCPCAGFSPAGLPANNQGIEGFFCALREALLRQLAGFRVAFTRCSRILRQTSMMDDMFWADPEIPNATWRGAQRLLGLSIGLLTYTDLA